MFLKLQFVPNHEQMVFCDFFQQQGNPDLADPHCQWGLTADDNTCYSWTSSVLVQGYSGRDSNKNRVTVSLAVLTLDVKCFLPPRLWCVLQSWSAPGRVEPLRGRTDLLLWKFLPCTPPWAVLRTDSSDGPAPFPAPPSPGAKTPKIENLELRWLLPWVTPYKTHAFWCCVLSQCGENQITINHKSLDRWPAILITDTWGQHGAEPCVHWDRREEVKPVKSKVWKWSVTSVQLLS